MYQANLILTDFGPTQLLLHLHETELRFPEEMVYRKNILCDMK
jgi:hypothetical protein